MIRILFVIILFIAYGNFNYIINDLIIFSLINIAFFSVLHNKKLNLKNFSIYIFSTLTLEVLLGLPIFASSALIILLLLIISYLINNLSINKIIISFIFFVLSLITIFSLDISIFYRIINFQYLLSFLIIFIIYLGLKKYGTK